MIITWDDYSVPPVETANRDSLQDHPEGNTQPGNIMCDTVSYCSYPVGGHSQNEYWNFEGLK